jgi:transcription termination factor Rho
MEKRIFPCLDINKSSTRKEDLLVEPSELQKIFVLRRVLHPMNTIDSMEFVLAKVKNSKTNQGFMESMNG